MVSMDEGNGTRVAARHLEEVLHQRLKDGQVRGQEVEALLSRAGTVRWRWAWSTEAVVASVVRGERKLVTDVAGESRVTLEPVHQLAHHLVEGLGEL